VRAVLGRRWAGRRVGPRGRGCLNDGGVEGRVLPQHLQLQLSQGLTRLHAELLDQGAPGVGQRPERLGLLPAAVAREGEAAPARLVERSALHGLGQLAEQRGVPTEQELGLVAVTGGGLAALVQPRDDAGGERPLTEAGQRLAPPLGLGLHQQVAGAGGVAGEQRGAPALGEVLEDPPVERRLGDSEPVAAAAPLEHRTRPARAPCAAARRRSAACRRRTTARRRATRRPPATRR
jgi:hypothetical protein